MNFDDAVAYLLSLGHEVLTMKLGLADIERLLQALGNPHHHFASVQIAGTNGKGSTAVVLDSICGAAKINRGLYTSPHLVSITERIRINGEEIAPADFARLTRTVKETATTLVKNGELAALPTFFEHLTAIALLAFRDAGIKLAILETGLGGRLDATTAAGANIVGLTAIAEDHQEYLGETLAEIASEKAAIIRAGSDVIVGPQPPEALAVVLSHCEVAGVKPTLVEDTAGSSAVSADGRVTASLLTSRARYESVRLGLRGRHQVMNVGVAIGLAEALSNHGFVIPHEAIIAGIETASHPGRLDILEGKPRILLDGAHNPAAVRALCEFLDEFTTVPLTLVFGAMRDKGLQEMLATLTPRAEKVVLTAFSNPRAASVELLSKAMPTKLSLNKTSFANSAVEALQEALAITPPGGLVCVTGSLYLVGEIKKGLSVKHGL